MAEEGSKLSYFAFGLGLGLAVGVLFAPKSGEETREYIRVKADEGRDYLRRRGEDLRAVANCGDRLVLGEEVPDDLVRPRVETQIFGRPAAGNDQGVVARWVDVGEAGVEREIVAAFFGIGLVAFKIVDGGADGFAGFLAGTNGVDHMANH